jgi:hypothetical protein
MAGKDAQTGTTLVRYLLNRTNTRAFKGEKSGVLYRFGDNPGHRQKYVYDEDINGLLAQMDGGQNAFAVVQATPQAPEPVAVQPSGVQTPSIVAVGSPNAIAVEDVARPTSLDAAVSMAAPQTATAVPPMTIKEMTELVPQMAIDEVAQLLTGERAGANRVGAIKVLEHRMAALS